MQIIMYYILFILYNLFERSQDSFFRKYARGIPWVLKPRKPSSLRRFLMHDEQAAKFLVSVKIISISWSVPD